MLDIDESLQQTEPDSLTGLGNTNFIMRRPGQADLATLIAMANDPVLTKNLCTNWLPTRSEKAALWLAEIIDNSEADCLPFVLTDMKGSVFGAACLSYVTDTAEAEVSILIQRPHWHKGHATRSLQALADIAFSNPNPTQSRLQSLIARCRVTCGSSRRVVEKCAFQYCGTGMAHSQHYRGLIPIDRYRLDRGVWTAIRSWAGAGPVAHTPSRPSPPSADMTMKGAA